MKPVLLSTLAISAALGFANVGNVAYAQSPPSADRPAAAQPREPHDRMSQADRAAFLNARIEGRIAAIHAGLALTPDQEKLWAPVETAVRESIKARRSEMDSMRAGDGSPDPIERLKTMASAATLRGQSLGKIADAAAPLYGSLSEEQKRRLPALIHIGQMEPHGGLGERGAGWRERMARWMGFGGRSGPDGCGSRDMRDGGGPWQRSKPDAD